MATQQQPSTTYQEVEIDSIAIRENFNPRTELGDLDELKASLKATGLINPITVCKDENKGFYLIAGARRLAAYKDLGFKTIPAMVRNDLTIDSQEALGLAIGENLEGGRQNLLDLDLAKAYARLYEKVKAGCKDAKAIHTAIGKAVGRSYKHVEQALKLLDLPASLQDMLARGDISKQAVLTVTEVPEDIRQRVADRIGGSTDRVTEKDVRRIANELRRNENPIANDKVVDLETAEAADTDVVEPVGKKGAPADGSMIAWRSKTEVKDMIDIIVRHINSSNDEDETVVAEDYSHQLAALLWVTGAIDAIEIGMKPFKRELKKLSALSAAIDAEQELF